MFLKFTQMREGIPNSLLIDIKISNQKGIEITEKAMIDTGADITSIPTPLAESLKLIQIEKTLMRGVYGKSFTVRAYSADIYICDILFKNVKVCAIPISRILIGRDLINLCNLKIIGNAKKFSIKPWSVNINDSYSTQ